MKPTGNVILRHVGCGLAFLLVHSSGVGGVADQAATSDQWAFQPLRESVPPNVDSPWVRTDVDRFILAKLDKSGITPAPGAERRTLIRRLTFDLTGLAPTVGEIDAFVNDPSPNAYEHLVDRLLSSEHYGEHWARHWLDVVRYADSNGFRADEYRPLIWRYRDWVIDAFNRDMPYDQFVKLQLAGDELHPNNADALISTGFLRLWPYESNQRNVHRQWGEILDNVTDIAGDAFLGVSMSCAKCHDHKFDPIKQRDYYALRAFFSSIYPDTELTTAGAQEQRHYAEQLEVWRTEAADVLAEMAKIREPIISKLADDAVSKFSPEIREIWNKEDLTSEDKQVRLFVQLQIELAQDGAMTKLKDDEKKQRWEKLVAQLGSYDHLKPKRLPEVMAIRDVGRSASPTFVPGKEGQGEIPPAFLSALNRERDIPIVQKEFTTGRRSALARWLTAPDHPLTTRVIVNRSWHHLFGRGIVATTNDFGKEGARPTHPELLDWLAKYLPANDWSMKKLHRLLVTSATYRQASGVPMSSRAEKMDPNNDLLWRMRVRRLNSEQLRDAMLVASGDLDSQMSGPGVAQSTRRRAIYQKIMRNDRPELMATFDGPDTFNSCARRDVTTTPTQALFLLNNSWSIARGEALAQKLKGRPDFIAAAYQSCFGRFPNASERAAAKAFIATQTAGIGADAARADFSHALLNANEFLYLD